MISSPAQSTTQIALRLLRVRTDLMRGRVEYFRVAFTLELEEILTVTWPHADDTNKQEGERVRRTNELKCYYFFVARSCMRGPTVAGGSMPVKGRKMAYY
jgi:hypothetical protein